ncbi:MAG: metallophosphoesterase, partial [Flavihumibacter sp.]
HRLEILQQGEQPLRLLIVGDFFHSTVNKEADLFARWRHDHASLHIDLVRGNHDILPADWYRQQDIRLHDNILTDGPFAFVHEWNEYPPENKGTYFLSGHIHPGIRLRGLGRQQVILPCFYFGKKHAILPAFGGFTGLAALQPQPGDQVFVIGNKQLIAL